MFNDSLINDTDGPPPVRCPLYRAVSAMTAIGRLLNPPECERDFFAPDRFTLSPIGSSHCIPPFHSLLINHTSTMKPSTSRAISALARPTLRVTAPVRPHAHARGHATAVDPPAPGPGVSREESGLSSSRYEPGAVRRDWRRSEIQRIFDGPLMETIFRAVS